MRPTRRQVLAALGAGSACWILPPAPVMRRDAVGELAEQIRGTKRSELNRLAARCIKAGVDWQTMLAAGFVAGVKEISPWPCGNRLHAVFAVDSVRTLAAGAGKRNAWLGTLWSVDAIMGAQEHDVRGGDWVLSRPPASAQRMRPAEARRTLDAALGAWDWQKADAAMAALARHHEPDALFEAVWPWAGRCSGSLAHKIIYAAQADRSLSWIGKEHAGATMRSLVRGLLFRGGRRTAASDRAHRVLDRLPARWLSGREEPESSHALLRTLRNASVSASQDAVISAFQSGLGPRTVWDGLRLYAAELFARRRTDDARQGASILPVHTVTAMQAFGHAFDRTKSEVTKRLLVLQAAGWLAQLHGEAERRVGFGAERRGEALPYDDVVDPAWRPLPPHGLFRSTVEVHQYKLAAALAEDARKAAPRWRAHLLGSARGYLPSPGARPTELARRSERHLDALGIRGG